MESAEFGFDNAPVGLVVTGHRIIRRCNIKFADMFGYATGDLEGLSLSLLYPSKQEFLDVGKWALSAMNGGLRYEDQRIMRKRDGTHFWCRVRGQSMTSDDPYARCVWSFTDLADARPVVRLTQREREIAMLVADGMPNKEIARRMELSHRTVEAHRSRMMRKLEVANSAELIAVLAGLPGLK
uniref:PAS and helix-turn-helix domain-containing protein n=1 Tax=Neorhizobium sp. EC2-8 TaxID=3129230 RepID=UPI003101B0AD